MLYALRYERHSNNDISGLLGALQRRGVTDKLIKVSYFELDVLMHVAQEIQSYSLDGAVVYLICIILDIYITSQLCR